MGVIMNTTPILTKYINYTISIVIGGIFWLIAFNMKGKWL